MDRISDLSGPLLDLAYIEPYFTGYPLPSGSYYAFAKTWIDSESHRSGSVMTHTLIFNKSEYGSLQDVRILFAAFSQKPDRSKLREYSRRLIIQDHLGVAQDSFEIEMGVAHEFVAKYFGRQIRPILWLDNPNPNNTLGRLLGGLWPNLRADFSFCTFSLRYRTLGERQFDILFAPSSRRNKHNRLQPQNVIRHSTAGYLADTHTGPSLCENNFTQMLFADIRQGSNFRNQFLDLWEHLDDERNVLQEICELNASFEELRRSRDFSARILELVSGIAPAPNQAPEMKQQVVLNLLESLPDISSPAMMTEALHKISTYLDYGSFSSISSDGKKQCESLIAEHTSRWPELAIAKALERQSELSKMNSVYLRGFTQGLQSIAKESPAKLLDLEFDVVVSPVVFALQPEVGYAYYTIASERGLSKSRAERFSKVVQNLQEPDKHRLRSFLLSPSLANQDPVLVGSLLEGLHEENVRSTLEILLKEWESLCDNEIYALIKSLICDRFPSEIVELWRRSPERTNSIAPLLAATASFDSSGIEYLEGHAGSSTDFAHLYLWLFQRSDEARISNRMTWILEEDPTLLEVILKEGSRSKDFLADLIYVFLMRILDRVVAVDSSLLHAASEYQSSPLYSKLSALLLESIFAGYLSGRIDKASFSNQILSAIAVDWFDRSTNSEVIGSILKYAKDSELHHAALLELLNLSPKELYFKRHTVHKNEYHPIIRILDFVFRSPRLVWDKKCLSECKSVIARTHELGSEKLVSALSEQVLDYVLDHPNLPIVELLETVFPTVYTKLRKEDDISPQLFDIVTWFIKRDRSQELLYKTIGAFGKSDWPPEKLALSMPSMEASEELVRQLRRTTRGREFLDRMMESLRRTNGEREKSLYRILCS